MSKRMIGMALLLAALCTGVTAHAGNAHAARKQVESSLLVKGSITIAPDGSVLAHTLDPKAPLGDAVSKFAGGNIATWRFEPVLVDGKVVTAKGTDGQMAMLRTQFTDAALSAARNWIFTPPVTGSEAGKSSWLVRVPVTFAFDRNGAKSANAGQWDSYIPGPRNRDMPWAREELRTAGAPDALSEGGVYPLQQGVKLLTPPAT